MKSSTLTLVQKIVDEQMGFFVEDDMVTLLSDDVVRNAHVLLRFDGGRKVVTLKDVNDEIVGTETAGNYLRDVSFTADQCDTFRKYL